MKWLKKNLTNILLILIALAGIGFLSYPTVADWWNSFHQSRAVASYAQAVADLDEETYEKMLADAEAYNKKLAEYGIPWQMTKEEQKEYNSLLNINDTGIMGYVDIPKINVQLPIYHGTDEAVLQIAVGHLAGTSLPIGGESAHCVLSGHRGLPSAKLFTDIDKLTEGDVFTMTVLDKTVTYEVDKIHIVEPSDLSNLTIEEGEDYTTLVTCTPYGVNTHRLLVRGHRIANLNGDADVVADAMQIQPVYVAPFLALPILLILIIWMFVSTHQKKVEQDGLLARTVQRRREEREKEKTKERETGAEKDGKKKKKKDRKKGFPGIRKK